MSSITEREIFKIIIVGERETHKNGKMNYSLVEAAVKTELQLENLNQTEKDILYKIYRKYKKLKDKHIKKEGYDYIETLGSTNIVLDLPSSNTPKKRVRIDDVEDSSTMYRKTFRQLSERMQKERTKEICEYLHQYVKEQCPELTMNNILGYLLKSENQQTRKDIAKVGNQLFCDTFELKDEFSVEDAIVFMHSLVLSKEQLRKVRYMLQDKGIYFPTTNEILTARKKLRPTINPILGGKGVNVDYKELVQKTISSVIDVVKRKGNFVFLPGDSYLAYFKDGGDGAGTMPNLKSKLTALDSKENIFQYGLTILKMDCKRADGTLECMWENQSPNSARSVRPIFLIREKETDEDLLNLVIPSTDMARTHLNENGICILMADEVAIHVGIKIQDTMKDLKFKRDISGLKGADCILCHTKCEDWTKRENILNGFPINRCAEETWELYNQLVDEDGNIPIQPKDFETRKGLTKKPLTNSSQESITITHSYINGTNWFIKMLARCHSDIKCWVESKDPRGDPIRYAKNHVLDTLHAAGLVVETCASAGAKGGTSTTGGLGRILFSEDAVSVIEGLCHPKHREQFMLLHLQLSIILRVVSCSKQVNVDAFAELCKEFSLNLVNNFPWARLNHTLHGTVHHSSELIVANDGYGLGSLSEEGLESNNKDIRNYLEKLSRKTSQIDQLTDIMCRLLERSDPVHADRIASDNINKYCKLCGSCEHTVRSHGRIFAKPKKEFDSYFDDIVDY